jgi:transposase
MTSRIVPIKDKAVMMKKHFELIMNWHRAKGLHSLGVVEGLNTKVKLTVRKHYGFRELEIQKSLYISSTWKNF